MATKDGKSWGIIGGFVFSLVGSNMYPSPSNDLVIAGYVHLEDDQDHFPEQEAVTPSKERMVHEGTDESNLELVCVTSLSYLYSPFLLVLG